MSASKLAVGSQSNASSGLPTWPDTPDTVPMVSTSMALTSVISWLVLPRTVLLPSDAM
jgi:hypothetical protein